MESGEGKKKRETSEIVLEAVELNSDWIGAVHQGDDVIDFGAGSGDSGGGVGFPAGPERRRGREPSRLRRRLLVVAVANVSGSAGHWRSWGERSAAAVLTQHPLSPKIQEQRAPQRERLRESL